MSFETTTAGRVFLASAPTVGSKLTKKISPRLIETIREDSFELLVDPADLCRRLFIFSCKSLFLKVFEGFFHGLSDEPTPLSGFDVPRELFQGIFRETYVHTNRTHCVSLMCIFIT